MNHTQIHSEPSDQELIVKINSGDDQAFEKLYYRYRDWVFFMARRITNDKHLSEDVLQEVFQYFLSKFPGFELRCQLKTFLYPVIRNHSISALRKSRRFANNDINDEAINQLTAPVTEPSENENFHLIIESLKPNHREILYLRFVDGMSLPELADFVGVPLGTAKSRLHHAIASLRSNPKLKNQI